jgi:hypothetical protein
MRVSTVCRVFIFKAPGSNPLRAWFSVRQKQHTFVVFAVGFNFESACFSWFLPFGNRNQNSMVAGARPNHQPIGDLEPTQAGLGPVEEPDTLTQCAPVFPVFFWNKLYFIPFGYSCPTLASLRAIELSASARAGQRGRRVRRERRLATHLKKSSMTGMYLSRIQWPPLSTECKVRVVLVHFSCRIMAVEYQQMRSSLAQSSRIGILKLGATAAAPAAPKAGAHSTSLRTRLYVG